MYRLALGLVAFAFASSAHANDLQGAYVEARTCQVYTGPCFANGEVGLAGKDAVLSWRIDKGEYHGVKLTDLSVAMVVKASDTLGFRGLSDAETKKCVVVVDENASEAQKNALTRLVLDHTGLEMNNVMHVTAAPVDVQLNVSDLTATVEVGRIIKLQTRKARPGDCICSNESAYYPPLVELKGSVPGVTIQGDVTARRLGTRWSIPDSRTAYMGMFELSSNTDNKIVLH